MENSGLENFTEAQKEEIFKRDNYRCVVCGLGRADGLEIHAGYIKPKNIGGKAEIINGQTVCTRHKTETGKKIFVRLYELAKAKNDKELQRFCLEILEVYEKNKVNDHISWKK